MVWTERAGAEAHEAAPAGRGSCNDAVLEAAVGTEDWINALREAGASGLAQGSELGTGTEECRSWVMLEDVQESCCEELSVHVVKGLKICPRDGMGESSEEVASFPGFGAAPKGWRKRSARSFARLDMMIHSLNVCDSA